jgi:hypothetical protein
MESRLAGAPQTRSSHPWLYILLPILSATACLVTYAIVKHWRDKRAAEQAAAGGTPPPKGDQPDFRVNILPGKLQHRAAPPPPESGRPGWAKSLKFSPARTAKKAGASSKAPAPMV